MLLFSAYMDEADEIIFLHSAQHVAHGLRRAAGNLIRAFTNLYAPQPGHVCSGDRLVLVEAGTDRLRDLRQVSLHRRTMSHDVGYAVHIALQTLLAKKAAAITHLLGMLAH